MTEPHTFVVVTPAVVEDSRGDDELSYGDDATRVTTTGMIQQIRAEESLDDRDVRQTTWRFLSTSTPGLTSIDRIEWNDGVFEVVGQPNHITYGTAHCQARLSLVEG